MAKQHPMVDFDHWSKLFPIESLEDKSGPRRFPSSEPDDRVDLWKVRGTWITSPSELCQIELVRRKYAREQDIGEAVPVDIFLWSTAPPVKPYFTKIGGVPHREADKP